MRNLKAIPAFCLALSLLLCGCGRQDTGADTTRDTSAASVEDVQTASETTDVPVSATAGTPTAKEGFTVEDLRRENSLTNLVRAYSNVRVCGYYNGEQTGETHYIWHNGEVATAEKVLYEGSAYYSGAFGAMDFEQVGDRLQSAYDLSGESVFLRDDEISSMLLSGEIADLKDMGGQWSFRILPSGPDAVQSVCVCVAEKETLALDSVTLTLEDGDVVRHTIEHAPDLALDGFGLLDGLSRPYRKIRVCTVLHDGTGKEVYDSTTLEVPYNLEIIPVSEKGQLNMFLNENLTKAYVYPGNGKNYTVWATDAMG